MHEQTIAIYCICEEVATSFGLKDDSQCKMTTSEVMTFALVSAIHYQCDYHKTRLISRLFRFFKNILSLSRLVRRIHAIQEAVWLIVFSALRMYLRKSETEYFIVDSFPVKAYESHKSFRARIFREKIYHGYSASKKSYFFGIKVHMIVDENGVPMEFCFTPGSLSDLEGFKNLSCDLPPTSTLLGDRAYTHYSLEEDLLDIMRIKFVPKRKNNSKKQHTKEQEFILSLKRNRIETTFSGIVSKMPRYIRARTKNGFYIKVALFIIAYLIEQVLPLV
jgi:DDE family transposase